MDVRRPLGVPSLVATDRLIFPEDFPLLYYLDRRAYWAREFYIEARVRKHQKFIARWHNVELSSLRISDGPRCYCQAPFWSKRYEVPTSLFVGTPMVLVYYSVLIWNGSAYYQAGAWTFAITEYVIFAGIMFIANGKDRTNTTYYSHKPRFHHVGDYLLFRLPPKSLRIWGMLVYIDLSSVRVQIRSWQLWHSIGALRWTGE